MVRVKHFIQIFFDEDRPDYNVSRTWVENRWRFFLHFVYKSLRNQSEWGNFRILLCCGQKHREYTSALDVPEAVTVVYDRGKKAYSDAASGAWFRGEPEGSRYIAITRIDSDDLMAPDAMSEVVKASQKHAKPKKRACLVFRKNLQWNIHNEFVGPHYRKAPPFVTHIFPAGMIRDRFNEFASLHYLPHGRAGGRDKGTIELGKHKILITKHTSNISVLKRDAECPFLTERQRINLIAEDDRIQIDRKRVFEALKRFGVDPYSDRAQWLIYTEIVAGAWSKEVVERKARRRK